MIAALVSTAAMSVGAVAATLVLHPLLPFAAFALALAVMLRAARAGRADPAVPERFGRALVALAVVAAVGDRHLFVSWSGVAPDDVLAALVVAGALALPRGPRWAAAGAGAVLATYLVVGATLIAAKPYHSDAVVSTHGAAELLLAGRHPYADFDLLERLARFGLPPELSTALEDGTRVRSLQYPALAILVPAPLVAAGLADLRVLYLLEVLAIFGLVLAAAAPGWRAVALAACVGNLVILDQFVLAGVDPLWALLLLGAWLLRADRVSAVLLGLAVAARQPAWLIAPFLFVWMWQRLGRREALVRAAIALGVALLVHAPFLVSAPGAVIDGLLDSALEPQEPWGIGPAKLAGELGAVLPRMAFLAAAGSAYLLALWAVAAGHARGAAPLVLPLLPLWAGWRALQNYFAFLPLFLVLDPRSGSLPRARALDPAVAAARSARPGDGITLTSLAMPVDKELLEILACPLDHAPVREEGERLICTQCGRRYPVRDGIPVMLIEEAEMPETR